MIITVMSKTVSYGVINIKLTGEYKKYNEYFKKKYTIKNNIDTSMNIFTDISLSEEESKIKENIFNNVKNSVLFLLISRKHSLGYLEFIRGRYNEKNIEEIKHLFVQMSDIEMRKIFSLEFKTLWFEIWKRKIINKHNENEYFQSKAKFNYLVYGDMRSFLQTLRPKYPTIEWGFPKGRKNHNENELKCAMRECSEETTLHSNEMNILKGVPVIVEDMIGTNNVNYKHVYYISVSDDTHFLCFDNINTKEHYIEVEQIAWLKHDRIMNLIRPYHIEKKNIIKKLIMFITKEIYNFEN